MIAYNQTWLANLKLQEILNDDLSKGRISVAEFKAITEKYPVGFFTPGVFARIGLFIVTCIVVAFADGLIALMGSNVIESAGFPIFLGLMTYAGLELMVNMNKHYRSGVDDALLFICLCQFLTAFFIMFAGFNGNPNYIVFTAVGFILSLTFAIRFADMLMSLACCVFLFAFVYFFWTTVIPSGMATVPFALMLVSAGAYWLVYTNRNNYVNYENCLAVAQVVCLLTLYMAGNFYIIQTLSDELHNATNTDVPFGAFFWAWTIGVPFVYVGFGIKKKDTILLRTGLLLIIAAALTFRYYYHILPLDVTLTLAGAVVLGIAYATMRYLKTPKHGFTYVEPDDKNATDRMKIESLIVAETFSATPHTATSERFGGGDFGGGGSSDSF